MNKRELVEGLQIEYEEAPHLLFTTHKERFTHDLLAFLQQA